MTKARSVKIQRGEDGFDVVITNDQGQNIIPLSNLPRQDALTEAADWADFLGVTLVPFRHLGKLIKPIRRKTYIKTVSSRDELAVKYSDATTGELNLNKMMHDEWECFRKIHPNKTYMIEWLLPYFIPGEQNREWISSNCAGHWLTVKGGYRFDSQRDATLFKLFYGGQADEL